MAMNPTGMAERINTTFRGSPLSSWLSPVKNPKEIMVTGTRIIFRFFIEWLAGYAMIHSFTRFLHFPFIYQKT